MQVCKKCGKEVPEDVKFCTSCGKEMAIAPLKQGRSVSQPTTPGQYAVVSTLGWLGNLILLGIPIVGLILCFKWAFGEGNHNRRNLARACLILMAVGIILCIVFVMVLIPMLMTIIKPYIEQIQGTGLFNL